MSLLTPHFQFVKLLVKEKDMTLGNNVENTKIPGYSRKQEIFNSISHFLGVPFALFIIIFGICMFSKDYINSLMLFGYIVFGVSALAVYLISSIYHITPKESPKKKKLRILDHCTIYLLIAGTYTPICFSLLEKNQTLGLGIFMLIFQWAGLIIGVILNAFFFQNKVGRVISFILYIVMGWLALFCGAIFYVTIDVARLILIGGIIYTVGSILYACGHGWKWFHFIFHIFVLFGTIIQAIGVFLI